ncbi:MAG: hypothetical protein GYA23_02175, partial [Methanomicrobiales archaeon]|nr:hypothetical protein [Methanomicrobiales archaeon]
MTPRFCQEPGLSRALVLLILAGTVLLVASPASAGSTLPVTIQSNAEYVLGEELSFSGYNHQSGTTYLFITGPNLPQEGGNPTAPQVRVITGNVGSFAAAPVSTDNRWEYHLATSPLG